jgi:hypothetical protein
VVVGAGSSSLPQERYGPMAPYPATAGVVVMTYCAAARNLVLNVASHVIPPVVE